MNQNSVNCFWMVIPLVLFGIVGISDSFAEKTVSIQRTVDADKESLEYSLNSLEKYSEILPKYIQSSDLIGEKKANMKIGLDWISIDADVKSLHSEDLFTLEVLNGDFKGTKLYVSLTKDYPDYSERTRIVAELDLKQSWHMELFTSFVSDEDIESMLHTSLDGLVDYTKNPPSHSDRSSDKKEKFCLFGLCF